MTRRHDMEPLVEEWLHRTLDAIPDPIHRYPAIATEANQTPQQRGWLPQMPKWRFQSMFSATKFVVAAAIVALFGGFLLAGVLTQPPENAAPAVGATTSPQATTTPPLSLPAEIPDGVATGTLDTPLGPARWVHLSGDDTTLPTWLDPVPDPSGGYISLDWDSTPPRLWRSPDLITWAFEALPIEARWGGLTLADDTLWVSADEPVSLWSSVDTLEWTEESLDGLVPPGPDGYAWRLDLGTAKAYDGVTIVPTTYYADYLVVSRALIRPSRKPSSYMRANRGSIRSKTTGGAGPWPPSASRTWAAACGSSMPKTARSSRSSTGSAWSSSNDWRAGSFPPSMGLGS